MSDDATTNGTDITVAVAGSRLQFDAKVRPEGNYPPLIVTLLVPLPARVIAFEDAWKQGDGKAKFDALAGYVLEHVLKWDATGADDVPAPVTRASVERLPADYLYAVARELNAAAEAVNAHLRSAQEVANRFMARTFGDCLAGALRKAADHVEAAGRDERSPNAADERACGIAAAFLRHAADRMKPAAA